MSPFPDDAIEDMLVPSCFHPKQGRFGSLTTDTFNTCYQSVTENVRSYRTLGTPQSDYIRLIFTFVLPDVAYAVAISLVHKVGGGWLHFVSRQSGKENKAS